MGKSDECVKVVVRIRPLSTKEKQNGHYAATTANESRGEIVCKNPRADEREPPKVFSFDNVFSPDSTQRHIYDVCAAPVVESVLAGYNGTIFAYGQTGAGKTHTMEGLPDPPEMRGIIPNSFQHIFDQVALGENKKFLVRASYLEIYNEEIRDLLSKDPRNNLELKENVDTGVYVKDLTSFVVRSASEIDHVMQSGKKNRSVGATLMNQTSSRSHSIFTIVVECQEERPDGMGEHITAGKLNLVDLAGSERQSKTGATGDRLKEATKINLSLSALGNVISALVDGKSQHIPYRDSKLTRLLQDSLGGNTKTVMCANCGPADYNYDETVTTLRYANRAKNIKNKPRINEDPKDAMLREYQEEIERLKSELLKQDKVPKGVMMVDGKEVPIPNSMLEKEIVEKIIEKEVIREVQVGVSEEQLKEIEAKAQKEKEELRRRAAQDMKLLLDQQTKTDEERAALKSRLEKEARERMEVETQKDKMLSKIKQMEAKLLMGGEMMDKAAKQEAKLRKAQIELEKRQEQEAMLARELAEKEEMNLQMEEQYSSLQEEVEVKTRKLKKLWAKFQAANSEIQDLQEEFQQEREDMLETIRDLTRQLKLRDCVIANFVPPEHQEKIESRAQWDDERDMWVIPHAELGGNHLRSRRILSATGLSRPESEYARHRKQYDPNPRYRQDNIMSLDLDMAERTTQEYEGPEMQSQVQPTLSTPLDLEDEQVVCPTAVDNALPNPYLNYHDGDEGKDGGGGGGGGGSSSNQDDGGGGGGSSRSRPKSGARRSSKSRSSKGGSSSGASVAGSHSGRPSTASRRRKDKGGGGSSSASVAFDEKLAM